MSTVVLKVICTVREQFLTTCSKYVHIHRHILGSLACVRTPYLLLPYFSLDTWIGGRDLDMSYRRLSSILIHPSGTCVCVNPSGKELEVRWHSMTVERPRPPFGPLSSVV